MTNDDNDDNDERTNERTSIPQLNRLLVRMPALEARAISPYHHSTISHTAPHFTYPIQHTSCPVPHIRCHMTHVSNIISRTL